MTDNRIEHLVVVTGPTSSGKSTLLDAIKSNRLQGTAHKLLPPDIHTWGEYPCSQFKGQVSLAAPEKGLLLHYDFMRPFKKILNGYEGDLADKLMDHADRVTVCIIKLDGQRLFEQLKKGELSGKKPPSSSGSMRIRKLVTQTFHLIPARLRGFIKKTLFPNKKGAVTDFNQILYFKYQEKGWVEKWYGEFDAFLNARKAAGSNITVHYVKPGSSNGQDWDILS